MPTELLSALSGGNGRGGVEPTFPVLVAAYDRLAAAMPDAELVVVPESHDHSVDPAATARVIARRLGH